MTEDRFEFVNPSNQFKDAPIGIKHGNKILTMNEVHYLLNTLCKKCIDYDNEVIRYVKWIDKLKREIEQLKLQYKELEISLLNNQLAYNDLEKENEELKQFQDRVFSWIDMNLQRLPTLRDDEFESDNEFADPSLYSGAIQILETMKRELKGDDLND